MARALDLTGQRREHYKIVRFAGHGKRNVRMWLCACDCGNEFLERADRLSGNGKTLRESCGCVRTKNQRKAVLKHGMTGSPEYKSWDSMKQRCRNPSDKDYPRYGGRGIRVSPRWDSFEVFLKDMGPRPGFGYTLDRIDVNGNYEPGNCRWATSETQNNNRRDNVKIAVNGRMMSLFAYFGRRRSPKWQRAAYRIRHGWPVADAIFQPAHPDKTNALSIRQ